jgi:transcriptional regulator with XRE-family HTH domain
MGKTRWASIREEKDGAMRFAEAQARSGLTDRELAERAGSSTRTVWRIKQGHLPTRESVMRRLAGALGVEVEGIDEFVSAKEKRVLNEARKQGVPEEVWDGVIDITFPPDHVIRRAALRSMYDTMRYLVEQGEVEEVDRVYRELRGKATAREEASRRQDTEQ